LENILNNQIKQYLYDYELLSNFQSGFRTKYSTTTALANVVDDISKDLDIANSFVILVMFDFSRAFESIDHDLLLQKLMLRYSFSKSALMLLYSYLSGRTQYVSNNSKCSDHMKLNCGVPQGSVLGPLLFSMFINDILEHILYSKYHLYADDLQIYYSASLANLQSAFVNVNHDINEISKYAMANGVSLNVSKTKAIIISKKQMVLPLPVLLLNGKILTYEDSVKNLGLIINNNLT